MKDQYVGDVNDYLKYSLLRALMSAGARRVLVCWMLTAPDARTDGSMTAYLSQAAQFREVDPSLFDALATVVGSGARSVASVARAAILAEATFDETLVPQQRTIREAWIRGVLARGADHDMLFFDPDNGLAVESVPKGRRHSDKYLYWDELSEALRLGPSVVVYQHFPRRPRDEFTQSLLDRVWRLAPEHRPFAIHDSRVVYVIAPNTGHARDLRAAAAGLAGRWGRRVRLVDAEQRAAH